MALVQPFVGKNYWGLTQQVGPWKNTPLDDARQINHSVWPGPTGTGENGNNQVLTIFPKNRFSRKGSVFGEPSEYAILKQSKGVIPTNAFETLPTIVNRRTGEYAANYNTIYNSRKKPTMENDQETILAQNAANVIREELPMMAPIQSQLGTQDRVLESAVSELQSELSSNSPTPNESTPNESSTNGSIHYPSPGSPVKPSEIPNLGFIPNIQSAGNGVDLDSHGQIIKPTIVIPVYIPPVTSPAISWGTGTLSSAEDANFPTFPSPPTYLPSGTAGDALNEYDFERLNNAPQVPRTTLTQKFVPGTPGKKQPKKSTEKVTKKSSRKPPKKQPKKSPRKPFKKRVKVHVTPPTPPSEPHPEHEMQKPEVQKPVKTVGTRKRAVASSTKYPERDRDRPDRQDQQPPKRLKRPPPGLRITTVGNISTDWFLTLGLAPSKQSSTKLEGTVAERKSAAKKHDHLPTVNTRATTRS